MSFIGGDCALNVGLTNCLFERSGFNAGGSNLTLRAYNNLFYQGGVWLSSSNSANAFTFRDNFFYLNNLTNNLITYGALTYDHNGYVTNYNTLGTGLGDVIVSNFAFQSSWLGDFYQPTNSPLINMGSTNAGALGLYHYTVTTNQVKEANSPVDIGYHYVAVDQYGNPIDSNSDGTPDYIADRNGNGIVDSGETPWAYPPVITQQPTNQTVMQGTNVTFSVTVTGTSPLSYQWYFNTNTLMVGATNTTLTLTNVQITNAGFYRVVITNVLGGVFSSNVVLTVLIPPVVNLTSPTNGQIFSVYPTNIMLTAAASDVDGNIVSVAFYNGTSWLGSDTTAPYLFTWNYVPYGSYALTAVATDNDGLVTTSSVVNIAVDMAPTASISSPVNGAIIVTPTNLTISASASDGDGTVARLQIFAGTNLLGTSGTSPFNLVWSNVPPGTWNLTAVATDDLGVIGTSSIVTFTANPLTNFLAIADAYVRDGSYSNLNYGTSTILEVQTNSGTGTNRDAYFKFDVSNISSNISSAQLKVFASVSTNAPVTNTVYSVTNTSWGETTITWSNKPPRGVALSTNILNGTNGAWYLYDVSSYIRSQRAAGSNWVSLALHDPINTAWLISINSRENASNNPALVVITTNPPPTVNITSPANNSVYAAPAASITISATASDDQGVAQIQFFAGTTSLGIVTPPVSSLTWSNVPAGTYSLSAVATDNEGLSSTSTPVSVTVDIPPVVTLTNPANGAVFIAGTNISLGATASDADGTVKQVQFFQGTTSLGTDTNAPYQTNWNNVVAGNYTLTAVATDNNGITSTSPPVNIFIDGPPAVSITSPPSNATFSDPTNITIAATASNNDGTLLQVQFFVGGVSLGVCTQPPYTVTWSNPPVGTYVLKAVATDDYGLMSTAIVTNIIVGTNLSAMANAYVWDGSYSNQNFGGSAILNVQSSGTGTNRDTYFKFNLGGITNVSSAKLNVYASLSATGSVSAAVYSVTNTGWGEYTITWSNKPARVVALTTNVLSGTNGAWYQFDVTLYVRTNSGVISLALHEPTNSAALISINSLENSSNNPVLIINTTNAPPTVSIASPASNTVYVATVGSIVINASANDVSGVAQVQFFAGTNSVGVTNSLGVDTSTPYSVTWNNPPAGTNWLTAVAVGNEGLSTTSAVVSVIMDIPPVVALTNPANGAVFIAGTNISLGATASDADGTVKQVQFFQGTTSLGTDTNAPYQTNWNNVVAGNYTLTAVATDNNGITSTSPPVNIIVEAPPVVSIASPANNANFTAPTNITITATASSSDGTSPQVQFFVGGVLLGTGTNAPYSAVWSNPPVGTFVLTAVATDDYGLVSTASVTNITIGTNFLAIADAHVRDGSYSNINYGTSTILEVQTSSGTGTNRDAYFKFDVSNISSNISSAQLKVFASVSTNAPVTNTVYSVTNTSWGETTITWSNKPPRGVALSTNILNGTNGAWYLYDVSSYIRSQRAAGSNWVSLALHDPINTAWLISINSRENASNNPALVVITTNPPPTVNITSPANNSVYAAPAASITISATASDDQGVAQIQFFAGTNSLGVVTTPPYSVPWSNVPIGTYALSAVAADNYGLTARSSVVNITVGVLTVVIDSPTNGAVLQ